MREQLDQMNKRTESLTHAQRFRFEKEEEIALKEMALKQPARAPTVCAATSCKTDTMKKQRRKMILSTGKKG